MFGTILSYLENAVVVGAICFVCGMLFGPKVKDWFTGVPADLRAALKGVEAKAKADIAVATAKVITTLPAPPAVVKPAAPVVQAAAIVQVPPLAVGPGSTGPAA